MNKLSMMQLLGLLDEKRAKMCKEVLIIYADKFSSLPGSVAKHQAWDGGLFDHMSEVMNIANILYSTMSEKRPLPFSLADALFVLFFHDFDKLERYSLQDGVINSKKYYSSTEQIKEILEERWSYSLTPAEYNALKYTHGEGSDYSKNRVMGELAAFIHCCDTISARIWFDYGKNKEEWAEEFENSDKL